MARPYDLYLRFLVTQGYDTFEKANAHLKDIGLIPITSKEFESHYELVHRYLPDRVFQQVRAQKFEGDFIAWMAKLDLKELWLGEPSFRGKHGGQDLSLVYGILQDPRLRITINALLVKGVLAPDIAPVVNPKFSSMLKEEHLNIYRKFFWNPQRMARSDWRAYLAEAGNYEKNILFVALTEPLDELKSTLDLPSKTNVSDALQYLLTQSYRKAKHYLQHASESANKEARAWIGQTVKLAEKYEKYRSGDVMDFGKELQMEFDYIESDFPTPDEQLLKEVQQKGAPKEGES